MRQQIGGWFISIVERRNRRTIREVVFRLPKELDQLDEQVSFDQ